MKEHVKVLGIIYIVFGVLNIVIAGFVFALLMGGGIISGEEEAMMVLSIVATVAAIYLLVIALPGIIAGIGLLNFKGWSRILTIILGILRIPNIPIGTAIGVYTLWVLMKDETVDLFKEKKEEVSTG